MVLDEGELERAEGLRGEKMGRIRNKLEKMGIRIEMRADGGYDTRAVFSLLAKLGIAPVIRIRIDATARSKGVDRARCLAVLEQFGGRGGCTNTELNRMTNGERRLNRKEWKKDVEYGLRWIVEIVRSAFKRVFGESVRALKPHTAIIEIATKVERSHTTATWTSGTRPSGRCAAPPPDTGPPAAGWPWQEAAA